MAGCGCLNRTHSDLSIFFGAITTTLVQATITLTWSSVIVSFFFFLVFSTIHSSLCSQRGLYISNKIMHALAQTCQWLPIISHLLILPTNKSVKNLPILIVDLFIYSFSFFSFSSCILKFDYYIQI